MSKDIYHYEVKKALIKEGWKITDDPLSISVGEVDFRMDLGAEKIIVAEKEREKIAVEVKSFISQSPVTEFHSAIGKYDNYLLALEEEEPDRILYLAIPLSAYNDFFQRPFIKKVLRIKQVKLLVYNPFDETIEQWIN